jgi:double-GTPase-like protein
VNTVACAQSDCQVGVSGRCLEGFDPITECPYLVTADHSNDEGGAYTPQDLVDLPSGEAMTEAQAEDVARSDVAKLTIIAGPTGSGKTTILTALFEAFQEAPFANYVFGGSRTLVGFERRAHLGREESGAETADTSHTSRREGVVFLHLELAVKEDAKLQHTHLLLSDISGELFKSLRDSSQAVTEMTVLRRANHLCLVVDGAKIADAEARQVARSDGRLILRSIVESNVLDPTCIIDVAFTKWDVIVEALEAKQPEDIQQFIVDTKETLRRIATPFQVRFHEVAARPPKSAKVPFAHGVPTLLRSWMDHEQLSKSLRHVVFEPAPTREFERFTDAVIMRNGLQEFYDIRRV